jgi:hypothetical protein
LSHPGKVATGFGTDAIHRNCRRFRIGSGFRRNQNWVNSKRLRAAAALVLGRDAIVAPRALRFVEKDLSVALETVISLRERVMFRDPDLGSLSPFLRAFWRREMRSAAGDVA